MTVTENTEVAVQAHVILRDGEWACLFDLASGGLEALRQHCMGCEQVDERIGDAWMLTDTGEPEKLAIRKTVGDFDEDYWAPVTVQFVRERTLAPYDEDMTVAEISYRVDGRA